MKYRGRSQGVRRTLESGVYITYNASFGSDKLLF